MSKTYHLKRQEPIPLDPFNYISCAPAERFRLLTVGTKFLLSPKNPNFVCTLTSRTLRAYEYKTVNSSQQVLLPQTVVYILVNHDQLDMFLSLTGSNRKAVS